jgi:hypothetical protein
MTNNKKLTVNLFVGKMNLESNGKDISVPVKILISQSYIKRIFCFLSLG